ncbi:hypothetical protein [Aeromonas phage SD04]|jgi:hypothetical protein|nr:hypothetical protein [Aeromonas phage SD04]
MITLEEAKQHQEMITELVEKLNSAIAHATMQGVHVELDINHVSTIGARNHPIVMSNVTINPCDIKGVEDE